MTKILLVEDDKSLREIYGVRLQAEGYEIVSAGDGEEALALAIKEQPALILSDVMMPKISGFDMLDILRSTTETKDVKVIMMTALSSDDQRARGEALGADRYLVKSQVGIEDVVRTVHDVLGDGIPAPAAAPTFPPASAIPAAPITPAPAAPASEPVASVPPAPAPAEPVMPPAPLPEPAAPAMPAPSPAPAVPSVAPEFNPAPTPEPSPAPIEAPAPLPTPEPAMPIAPNPTPEPAPVVPPIPAPETPAPMPAPAPVEAPAPIPAPAPSPLPEPTAPFSTPRPGSGSTAGDRVINPLPSADSLAQPAGDIASQMNQALASDPAMQPPQPPQPPVQPQ